MQIQPESLYNICIEITVAEFNSACQFCNKKFRELPDHILFDFYYKMYLEKQICLLGLEFSCLEVLTRLLKFQKRRVHLLKIFQSLIEHDKTILEKVVFSYRKWSELKEKIPGHVLDSGLRLGSFLSEAGWYSHAIEILNIVESLCKSKEKNPEILRKLLDCYHKKIYAESTFCLFKEAEKTVKETDSVIEELRKIKCVPNLAVIYSNYSALYFRRNEYNEAYKWTQLAIKHLDDSLPTRIIVDVLRQGSKASVMYRCFSQANLLISQAMSLAKQLYEIDEHPYYSDVLMDYGFYFLNRDSRQESVKNYELALKIRKGVFGKNNIHIALVLENLAYAHYVNEYSSGNFYYAKECAEKSISIMEKILPPRHLMLASVKRVKALILEEISLDMRNTHNQPIQDKLLKDAELLHKEALLLSHIAFGENNVQTAKHYGNLGRLYQSMSLYDEAEKMHLKAISIKEDLLGPNHYEVGLSIGHLASLYNYQMKRHKDAEKLYLRSVQISLDLFGDSYSGLEYDYRGLIYMYTELQDVANLLHYTQVFREWKYKRNKLEVEVRVIPKPKSLETVINEFISLH